MFFYLSVSISPSSIPFCLYLSSFSLYLSLCLYVSIWLSSFLFVSAYRHFLCIFPSVCLSVCLSVSICLSSFSLYIFLPLSVCKHLPIVLFFISFPLSVCKHLSIFLFFISCILASVSTAHECPATDKTWLHLCPALWNSLSEYLLHC
jgi:hypothetical protein